MWQTEEEEEEKQQNCGKVTKVSNTGLGSRGLFYKPYRVDLCPPVYDIKDLIDALLDLVPPGTHFRGRCDTNKCY